MARHDDTTRVDVALIARDTQTNRGRHAQLKTADRKPRRWQTVPLYRRICTNWTMPAGPRCDRHRRRHESTAAYEASCRTANLIHAAHSASVTHADRASVAFENRSTHQKPLIWNTPRRIGTYITRVRNCVYSYMCVHETCIPIYIYIYIVTYYSSKLYI